MTRTKSFTCSCK